MSEKEKLFHHILVPIDGSQSSVVAGRFAIRLAAAQRARITFIYVVDANVAKELMSASGRVANQVNRELEFSGQRYLDYISQLAENADLNTEQAILHGVPYVEIADFAKRQDVDLIVIARVGFNGPRRILIGSVTERVIEHAPCPVLVMK
jgi:nucleotide-binding universal stress UspA family protein